MMIIYQNDYEKVIDKFRNNEKLVCFFGNSVNIGFNNQKIINYKRD